jgi:2-amino-4-hydroxy-6-hydroxymethyldihydropteridine diphosphokinase
MKIYLSLGTNLGDRKANLREAIKRFDSKGIKIIRSSGVYETEPVGTKDQPFFLNMCVEASTELMPFVLLDSIKGIEASMGRTPSPVKWGPRIIDIDILFYSNIMIETDRLAIPHHEIKNRRFVLVPLAELAPDLIHPGNEKSVAEMLHECMDTEAVKLTGELDEQ